MLDKATLIAEALTRSGALKFGSFMLKSGITSPYYIDMSWLLSSPEDFETVVNVVAEEIKAISSSTHIDKLASIELKGALLLPSIAGKVKMPCVVVRKELKAYGLTGRLAGGEVKKGERLIFFDDLVTKGGSKLEGIKPIEQAGGKVEAILVVVDREQGGREHLEGLGYQVKCVTTISDIVRALLSRAVISHERADEILGYLKQ
ncbi:MAG: orotate phosphoribosyltransferase [Candidatus Bathyarchaeota archaeon]|nr:orotate phosphoribosyltransferase [Candidatus Bathyarchaeota archaeon]